MMGNKSVRFCPKCKSLKVRYVFGLNNLFGIVPRQKCMDCGYTAAVFPIVSLENELKKKEAFGEIRVPQRKKSRKKKTVRRKK